MFEDQERKDEIRLIAGYIINFAGMGVTQSIGVEKIMQLPLLDNEYKELPIKSLEEAIEILNKLVNGNIRN